MPVTFLANQWVTHGCLFVVCLSHGHDALHKTLGLGQKAFFKNIDLT
jgi:hypothetical protein